MKYVKIFSDERSRPPPDEIFVFRRFSAFIIMTAALSSYPT